MGGYAVEIRNFTKRFGPTVAVDNLNLDIYEGEIFGLLGPNGSGKTTTLLTLATVYRPTSGDIYVFGHSVTREGDLVRRFVGIAFQEPKALWIDTPYELLLWHARVVGYSSSGAKEVVREVMERLNLWEHRKKQFYQLSGGTRKKLEIAKVLIQRPRIAIFDEPTAQVDVITKHALWDMIRELRDEGSTVIVATNDMFEAERICERLAIMYKGKLRALGRVEELKDKIPGGDVVEIHYEGDESTVRRVLESMADVGKYQISDHRVRIYLNKGEEKAVEIISSFSRSNLKIKKIMIQEPTLDDVFFYFTGATLRE
ncbi:ATP-binding cassette domain-containing protein [Infirmifilum lucidum]|uniref:ATP-binding cassette domain-containing protein n=1 Tax=Infirmifilum lucidum TaxID=2776706 RepID=A0A7L9FIN6_9CREN|nr:ABC transporter ATP-binding protein [Infirmifilum lucidum]QOJ78893.1 ATP-binding cassette domain-containing protein [Infirmifilum lucidum]